MVGVDLQLSARQSVGLLPGAAIERLADAQGGGVFIADADGHPPGSLGRCPQDDAGIVIVALRAAIDPDRRLAAAAVDHAVQVQFFDYDGFLGIFLDIKLALALQHGATFWGEEETAERFGLGERRMQEQSQCRNEHPEACGQSGLDGLQAIDDAWRIHHASPDNFRAG